MEAAKRRVESLERVKDIVDKFDDGDIAAQSLLEPETYEQVYKPTVETLFHRNAAVKKSARDSALILSNCLKWQRTSNIELRNVEYVNKKKTTQWYASEEVNSSIPEELMSSLLNQKIPNENDLVKLKRSTRISIKWLENE